MRPRFCFQGILFLILGMLLSYCGGGGDSLPLLASYDFEEGDISAWTPRFPGHWRVSPVDGSMAYELVEPGEPEEIRAPMSRSILSAYDLTSFVLTGRLKCFTDPANGNRDMCVLFHYRDPTHFAYVHFSARSDEVHNIIGLVDGTDRVKINREPAGESSARMKGMGWYDFKVEYDAETGTVSAYLEDLVTPILTARETVLKHGSLGLGSFDDTGCFDDIVVRGRAFR